MAAEFYFVAKDLRRIPKWYPNNTDNFALAEILSLLEGKVKYLELTASETKIEVTRYNEKRLNKTEEDIYYCIICKTINNAEKVKKKHS